VFVLHAQWLDLLSSGANIGDCYLVTENGYENRTCHTDIETFRIAGWPRDASLANDLLASIGVCSPLVRSTDEGNVDHQIAHGTSRRSTGDGIPVYDRSLERDQPGQGP
jgi:hypothetical protein